MNFYQGNKVVATAALPSDTAFAEFRATADGAVEVPEGKVLAGWKWVGDEDKNLISGDVKIEGASVNVEAVFADASDPVTSHTVTFHDEDGSFLQTVEYKSDQAFGLFSEGIAPEKDGFEFAGWVYGDDNHTAVDPTDLVTGDWHVYASYVKKEVPAAKVFKVTFWDGLTWTDDSVVEVVEGETVAAPADPECKGYKFEGWFIDKALSQAYDFAAPVTEDMTLYAKWSKVEEAQKGEQAPVTPTDKNSGLPQTGDASMVAVGLTAASGAVLSAAGFVASKRRKH